MPQFYLLDLPYSPHTFLTRMLRYRKWYATVKAGLIVEVRVEGRFGLELTPSVWTAMFSEWVHWKQHYLEFLPEKAQTVLDVGAACGETALLYFLHGARRVICVEPRQVNFELLERNSRRNSWDTIMVQEKFRPSLLASYDFDFMKMDCEGCESQLLNLDSLPPCVIEVHGKNLLRDLMARFPSLKLARQQPRSSRKFDLWILGSRSKVKGIQE